MATTKQCKYLAVLSKRLNITRDFEQDKKLEVDEASKQIDSYLDKLSELNGKAPDLQQPEQEPVVTSTPEIDAIGFGLCFKKTMDFCTHNDWTSVTLAKNFHEILDKVIKLYVENRERILNGSSSSSLVYKGHGTYITQAMSDEYNASCNCEVI